MLPPITHRRPLNIALRRKYISVETSEDSLEDGVNRSCDSIKSAGFWFATISSNLPHLQRIRPPACCSSAWYVSPQVQERVNIGFCGRTIQNDVAVLSVLNQKFPNLMKRDTFCA